MSKFVITINTDNDAFRTEYDSYSPEQELARILEGLAGELVHGIMPNHRLFDYNGRAVGEVVHEVDEDEI
jgi:hypothetical protein